MKPSSTMSDGPSERPARHLRTASRVVHDGGKFRLRTDTLSLRGDAAQEKDIVEHPGSVVIIPITDEGEVVLIEQWRPSIDRYSIELPSGTRESGEPSNATAQRELREESGYRAGWLDFVGGLYPLTGYSTERSEVYIGRSLVHDPLPQDKLEDIRTVPKSVGDLWNLIASNEIDDALTVAAMALASASFPELVPAYWSASA